MKRRSLFLSLLALVVLAGCTTPARTTMLAPARPAVRATDGVRVYRSPPKRFEEIAIVEGRSLTELRAKAGEVGANGIIAGGITQKPGPVIGVGIGSSTYHVGRRSAYGFETSANFGIPTGSSVLTATAIYVP